MKVLVSGNAFEVDYDCDPVEGVILNEVALNGQDLIELVSEWVLDAIRKEIEQREAHERNWINEKAEYDADARREEQLLGSMP